MKKLDDPSYLAKLEQRFNKMNQDLKINGQNSGFQEYIKTCQEQNYNYELAKYEKLVKFLPRNSDIVLMTYKNFL